MHDYLLEFKIAHKYYETSSKYHYTGIARGKPLGNLRAGNTNLSSVDELPSVDVYYLYSKIKKCQYPIFSENPWTSIAKN